MIRLQSANICDMVQELENGDLNYIGVFNETIVGESLDFDLVTTWIGEKGNYKQVVKVVSPDGKILDQDNHIFTIEEHYHNVITSLLFNIDKGGVYTIEIYINDSIKGNIPLVGIHE